MAYVKKSAQDELESIKKDVHNSATYFRKNYQRYHDFVTFIYKTSLSPADRSVLQELQKPMVEFNVLEAYISRLCGEFSKMDPAFTVRSADGVQLMDPRIIDVVEGHLKAAFISGDTDSLSYSLYRDILSGGFSVAKIYTDYANSKSFDQKIFVERVFDPTLCGFDPVSRKSHKGDGRYCFELFPKTAEEAKMLYGEDIVKDMSFTRSSDFEDFNWAYNSQTEDVMLFCEYFKKKFKREKIVKLANGHVVPEKQYERFMEQWEQAGIIEQPPIVLNSRTAEVEMIEKFTLCENKIISHEQTSFAQLPLVFFDGNSVIIRDNQNSQAEQLTRPYVYQARDAQKLKNYSGQSLANEMENSLQSKWIAPIEAIPDNADYQIAYTNPQKATIMLYNMWQDNDPGKPVQPPREVQRTPIPPEMANTFQMSDQLIQGILGSYDAAMGVNDNDISGVAIMQGAMHSNAAAMPYTVGFIQGWNRLAEIYLDLLPKYYVTPRSIPVMDKRGKHAYYEINKKGNVSFDYDSTALEVKVTSGVNFAVQKQIALKTIVSLMQASPVFAQFMNQEGLEVLLDNIDIKGIDNIKAMAAQYMEQQKKMAAQAQQQPSPEQLQAQQAQQQLQLAQAQLQVEQAKIQQRAQEAQGKMQVDLTKIATDDAVKTKEADIKFLEVMSKIQGADVDAALKQQQVDAEQTRAAVDMAISVASHHRDTEKHEKEMTKKDDE